MGSGPRVVESLLHLANNLLHPESCHLNVSKNRGGGCLFPYISTSHQESPEKSQTGPGWIQRTRCVHPAVRSKVEIEKNKMARRQDEGLTLAVLSWCPCCTLLKRGPDVCSKSKAIFALHLALSWGRNMSPLVITKMDATGSQSTSYGTKKQPLYILGQRCFKWFHTVWMGMGMKIILSDEVENVPLWHFFPLSFVGISCTKSRHRGSKLPITLTKLWPLAFYWEATLCAAERDICSHG